jgi:hypothetical protein
MGLLGKIGEAFNKLDYHTSNEPEIVGKRWEDHVERLFGSSYFALIEKTHSFKTNESRFVESSKNPDFIFKYKPTGEQFAVECKFRTGLNDNRQLEWTKPAQLRRYQEFQRQRKIPVFVVIGLDIEIPDRDNDRHLDYNSEPDFIRETIMFNIPLSVAKYPALYESVFAKYERPIDKPFFWKAGILS